MRTERRDPQDLLVRIDELTHRLHEAEQTLEAIRNGSIDALMVATPDGEEQLFTLEGADHIYRVFLESIAEGALTMSDEGVILYANEAAEGLLPHKGAGLLGEHLRAAVRREDRQSFDALFDAARHQSSGAEIGLRGPVGGRPVYLSLRPLGSQEDEVVIGILTDLTELKKSERVRREAVEREARAERAAEEERSRLARDLHDSVTQTIFAASLKAEALITNGLVSGEAWEAVEDIRRLNRGALAQMRTLLLELRGQPVADIPIRRLLGTAAEATEGRSSVRVSLTINGERHLPDQLHAAVYLITQEALNNVAKHAQAANASVTLDLEPSLVRVVVEDDGCGFEPGRVDASHMGLVSMEERAREADAELSIRSEPDEGTVVRLTWRPL